jgi:porphobilinogen deaminase
MFLNFSFPNDSIGYIVDGVMDTQAIHYLRGEILKKLEEHDKINIYLEDAGVERFSLNSIIITTLFPHKHRDCFKKVAMVTDRKWIHLITSINNIFISATVRNFTTEKRMDAIAWITEDD